LSAAARQGENSAPDRVADILDESTQLRAMLSKAVASVKGMAKPC
jgi:hypothetical protein